MNNNRISQKPGIAYKCLKAYLKFLHDKVYYKKTIVEGKENIPEDGTPLLVVSNHQNCLNDALGLLFALDDRKAHFITRGDIFAKSPFVAKFFYSIGLLPSYRLQFEGEGSLKKNTETFRTSATALLHGHTVVMFPEAGHQQGHWLGQFTYGYTRLAFEAAERGNFQTDIMILPSCNHYSDYFGLRNELLIRFGKPISLKTYYDLYKTKPRTAQREVNRLVREQIETMMLDIRDSEHYNAIDFIRNTYGESYAGRIGLNSDDLSQKLQADRNLVAALEKASSESASGLDPVCRIADRLEDSLNDIGITFSQIENNPKISRTVLKAIVLMLMLPFGLFSCWPSLFAYGISKAISSRTEDRMWDGTFLYAVSAMITLPLSAVITLLLVGFLWNWPMAIIYVLLFPILLVFCWNYFRHVGVVIQEINFLSKKNALQVQDIAMRKNSLFNKLDNIIKCI